MRARPVLIGVFWYVAGAAGLLAIWLIVVRGGAGLLEVLDGGDLAVLLAGALVTSLAVVTLQHLGVGRPTAASSGGGARPAAEGDRSAREDEPWGSLGGILGAAVALAVSPPAVAEADLVDPARGTFDELRIDVTLLRGGCDDQGGEAFAEREDGVATAWTALPYQIDPLRQSAQLLEECRQRPVQVALAFAARQL